MKELIRFFKFLFFSISAGLIEFASFTLLNELTSLRYWPCYLIGLILSILWNLTLNRRFTFKSDVSFSLALSKVFLYYLIFVPVTTFGGDYLVEHLGFNEYLVTVFNMILNFVTEFLYQRYVVFRKTIDNR